MRDLFSPTGITAIRRFAASPGALIFDLDGTLAPIVTHFSDARVSASTAKLLVTLSRTWPIGIVTGRSVADAEKRLGFTPDYLFGNHGAERASHTASQALTNVLAKELNVCRKFLHQRAPELAARKVTLEDKNLSLALHYRQSDKPEETAVWLHTLLKLIPANVLVTDGHRVINILLPHAADKGDAMLAILRDCGVNAALLVGDDENDEAFFVKAPRQCVTVRIGPPLTRSCAQFRLDSQLQVNKLLASLLL